MTIRLSISSLAGTSLTLVAVGTTRLLDMFTAVRAAAPLSRWRSPGGRLAACGCGATVAGFAGGAGVAGAGRAGVAGPAGALAGGAGAGVEAEGAVAAGADAGAAPPVLAGAGASSS